MNIFIISIITVSVISMILFSVIRRILLLEQIKKYEKIRYILIHKLGIIKAESFSYIKLERIYTKLKDRKEEFKENPHILYDIISNTDDDFDLLF